MLDLVDKVVERVLDTGWPAAPVKPVFSFAPPNEEFPPLVVNAGKPVLNIYLTDVREHRAFRRAEWDRIPAGPTSSALSLPPAYLDISYLVSAWSGATDQDAADPPGTEHRYLGEALRILMRNPEVVPQALSLPDGGAVFSSAPLQLMAAYPEGGQPLNDFWTTMKQSWRPALQLVVTAPMDLLLDAPPDPVVLKLIQRYALTGTTIAEHRILIGGQVVRAGADDPIVGARVELVAGGQESFTDSRGRFTFLGLSPGLHRIRASAPGHTPLERDVDVPGAPLSDHIFELS